MIKTTVLFEEHILIVNAIKNAIKTINLIDPLTCDETLYYSEIFKFLLDEKNGNLSKEEINSGYISNILGI